jgi:hypothetical protein
MKNAISRLVHGSVRFGSVRFEPQKPTEPSNSNFWKFKLNRIEFSFKPNQFGSVKFGFFAIKSKNLIISSMKKTSPKSTCKLTNCREEKKKEKSKPLNLVVDWFQEKVKNFNMVEPKTHSNSWHLNPHKTITNTIEYWFLPPTLFYI